MEMVMEELVFSFFFLALGTTSKYANENDGNAPPFFTLLYELAKSLTQLNCFFFSFFR